MQAIKKQLYQLCLSQVNDRIKRLQDAVAALQQSSNEDTKSSAGDKYETGREMMQLEKNKLAVQLSEIFKMKKVLDQLSIDKAYHKVDLGSLVITSEGNYFISVALGKLELDKKVFYAISPVSPIGVALMSKSRGEQIRFNYKSYLIKEVI
jgi:transcription elongation GreA/GreB family factor